MFFPPFYFSHTVSSSISVSATFDHNHTMMSNSYRVVRTTLAPMPAIKATLYQSLSRSVAPATGYAIIGSVARPRLHPSSSVQQPQLRCASSPSSSQRRHYYLSLPTTILNHRFHLDRHDVLSNSGGNTHFQWRNFARDRGGKRVQYPRHRNSNRDGIVNGKSRQSHNNITNDERYDKYSFGDADTGIIDTKESKKKILVVGSGGILGRTLVSHFGNRNACNWDVVGADVVPIDNDSSTSTTKELGLSDYICLSQDASIADLTGELFRGVSSYLQQQIVGGGRSDDKREKDKMFDAIVCASGGWAGDIDIATYLVEVSNSGKLCDVDVEEGFARKNAEIYERMMRMNYYPIVAASQIGRRFMKRGGESMELFYWCD